MSEQIKGGFSTVKLYRRQGIAIKEIEVKNISMSALEILLLKFARSESLVRADRVDVEDGKINIRMDCADGDLRKVLRDRSVPYNIRIGWIDDMINGCLYLHSAGILHWDIKPGNVLIFGDRAKLTDFGLCYRIQDTHKYRSYGTSVFSAPELLAGEYARFAADIWALGLTFSVAISDRMPWALPFNKTTAKSDTYKIHRAWCNYTNQEWIYREIAPEDWIDRIDYGKITRLIISCLQIDPRNRPTIAMLASTKFCNMIRDRGEIVAVGKMNRCNCLECCFGTNSDTFSAFFDGCYRAPSNWADNLSYCKQILEQNTMPNLNRRKHSTANRYRDRR